VTIKHLHSSPSLCMDWAAYICCMCYLVSFCSTTTRFGLSNEITDFVCALNVWIECRVCLLCCCDNKSLHIFPRLFHKCHIVRATQPAHRRCIDSTLVFCRNHSQYQSLVGRCNSCLIDVSWSSCCVSRFVALGSQWILSLSLYPTRL